MHIQPHPQALEERGDTSPALFGIEKSVKILERKALVVSIFGLNFSHTHRRAAKEERGGLSCLFRKSKKIFGLDYPSKM